jgi:hypothetical protein
MRKDQELYLHGRDKKMSWKEIYGIIKEMGKLSDYTGYVAGADSEARQARIKEAIDKNELIIIDPSLVMAIRVRGDRLIPFVASLISDEDLHRNPRIPKFYEVDDPINDISITCNPEWIKKKYHTSTYSSDYLKVIWSFAQKMDLPVTMTMGSNAPLLCKIGPDIDIMLAPRIED